METMRWVLIHDGMKSYCQPMKCHQIVFWKACTKHAFESLISSRPCWLYDQDNLQKDMPPSYQRLKNHGEEISGSQHEGSQFRGQKRKNHDKNTGESRSTEKSVSVERTQGRLLSVESKREVYKGRCLQLSPRSQ